MYNGNIVGKKLSNMPSETGNHIWRQNSISFTKTKDFAIDVYL